jgi:hypothetical protein
MSSHGKNKSIMFIPIMNTNRLIITRKALDAILSLESNPRCNEKALAANGGRDVMINHKFGILGIKPAA